MSIFDDMNDAIFESEVAECADFVRKSGGRQSGIRVVPVIPDIDIGDVAIVKSSKAYFDIRKSEVAAISLGDQIIIGAPSKVSGVWQISEPPGVSDSDRSLWRCPCVIAARP